MLTFEEKYKAIIRKDTTYEGIFITAVKTTGIFCRPSCTARKPKPENVTFYETTKEAILDGFRPCKICNPLEPSGETPQYIRDLLMDLHMNPQEKIRDYQLRQRNLDPANIRRWFKKNHNITFHAYQRMLRINTAFNKIHRGETITQSAFDSGFETLSGFNENYFSIFKKPPTQSKDRTIINIARFSTPLGPMFGCATKEGICLAEFTERKMLETEFKDLCRMLNGVILPGENSHLDQLQKELCEYFDGKRMQFEVSLHTPGSAFQQMVWKKLGEIPYGETRSYKQQAINLGNPKAVRAVASANGCNRVAIVIPCHRVIGEDGKLVGYGGGLARKKWLLDFEKRNSGIEVQGALEFMSVKN